MKCVTNRAIAIVAIIRFLQSKSLDTMRHTAIQNAICDYLAPARTGRVVENRTLLFLNERITLADLPKVRCSEYRTARLAQGLDFFFFTKESHWLTCPRSDAVNIERRDLPKVLLAGTPSLHRPSTQLAVVPDRAPSSCLSSSTATLAFAARCIPVQTLSHELGLPLTRLAGITSSSTSRGRSSTCSR